MSRWVSGHGVSRWVSGHGVSRWVSGHGVSRWVSGHGVSRWAVIVVLVLAAAGAQAREEVPVSGDGYNRFTFGEAFVQVVLPPGAPLDSKPVALSGNTTLLLDLRTDMDAPVQMVVQLSSGKVVDLLLVPGAAVPAAWQMAVAITDAVAINRPQDAALIAVFQEVLADPNRVPEGFSREATPLVGRIRGLTADYTARYISADYEVLVLRLRSQAQSPILPQDLYVPGVAAVYIDGDAVGPQLAPLAIVLKAR